MAGRLEILARSAATFSALKSYQRASALSVAAPLLIGMQTSARTLKLYRATSWYLHKAMVWQFDLGAFLVRAAFPFP